MGRAAVFVRFGGCNLTCEFCDTNWELDHARVVTEADILQEITSLIAPIPTAMIILTGGEPLLQLNPTLCAAIRANFPHSSLAVETNGTVAAREDILQSVDHVVCSPKTTAVDVTLIPYVTELKVLWPFPGGLDRLGVVALAASVGQNVSLVLQPQTPRGEVLDAVSRAQWLTHCAGAREEAITLMRSTGRSWRVIPQLHRLMNIR